MANAKSRVFVDPVVGKSSTIILSGDDNAFSSSTKVKDNLIKDVAHGGEWTVEDTKVKGKMNQLFVIKVKAKTQPKPLDPPDTGEITITLTPSPPVDPVPATYVAP